MDKLKYYVDRFNENDEELYKNTIDNAHAYAWMEQEIPALDCPDEDIERTYYFRYWTYRKHIKKTVEDGYIITEFLPKVPWSGKHNAINAAAGHHIFEGRWLKNGGKYLGDYISFFLNHPDDAHSYSAWLATAAWKLGEVTGNFDYGEDFLPKLCRYYELWEETHKLPQGMFWSLDDRDAMEYSISGTTADLRRRKGVRPTLNSYMCADAYAIAQFARSSGDNATEEKYLKKHEQLRKDINENLWDHGFYRAFHYDEDEETAALFQTRKGESPRELIGYIPWMFCIPPAGRECVFELLTDKKSFFTEYGLATAEQSDKRFLYEVNHECLWNGYVWPFATSQTLTALGNVIHHYPGGDQYRDMYFQLLKQYASSQTRVREDGKTVPWIDEVRHPERNDWSSRTILRDLGWLPGRGGYERGKDYNHSTFCDLVISGLLGIHTENGTLQAAPIIPTDWDWFKLSNLHYRGKRYTVMYDKKGKKYGQGEGLQIICEK